MEYKNLSLGEAAKDTPPLKDAIAPNRPTLLKIGVEKIERQLYSLGFEDVYWEVVSTQIPRESVKHFVQLPLMAPALALDTLDQQTICNIVDECMDSIGIDSVRRDWLFMRAKKP